MPHQCVKCGTFYDDGSGAILKGCDADYHGNACGGKLFFYVKKERLAELQKESIADLSTEEKEQIESDVYDLIGDEIDRDAPVVLDIESVRVLRSGKYELDLQHLFERKQPLIYKLDDGKYVVDLVETFKKMRGKKK